MSTIKNGLDLDSIESRAHAGDATPTDVFALLGEIRDLREERTDLRTAVGNWRRLAQMQDVVIRQLRGGEGSDA